MDTTDKILADYNKTKEQQTEVYRIHFHTYYKEVCGASYSEFEVDKDTYSKIWKEVHDSQPISHMMGHTRSEKEDCSIEGSIFKRIILSLKNINDRAWGLT